MDLNSWDKMNHPWEMENVHPTESSYNITFPSHFLVGYFVETGSKLGQLVLNFNVQNKKKYFQILFILPTALLFVWLD